MGRMKGESLLGPPLASMQGDVGWLLPYALNNTFWRRCRGWSAFHHLESSRTCGKVFCCNFSAHLRRILFLHGIFPLPSGHLLPIFLFLVGWFSSVLLWHKNTL
ncbi:hypothetical protein KP509_05G019100 [Ceratopteris richardii]|uniref:Uncharacterized protein n=1 Tax=Ceratopteris richardii TaxID=49495 RepID=A0A8T2UNS9_CERRI|nr:hypothetical protein KP509_05G019100 [Ceratopteris richardii]